MKKIILACVIFLNVAVVVAAQQTSGNSVSSPPEQGLMIVPGGDRVAIIGRIVKEGISGFRIYRKTNNGEAEMIGELPAWKRDPNILIQEIGEEEFMKLAGNYKAKTPSELMHNAASNPGILFAIMAIVPRYPRLIGLFENSYIYIDAGLAPGVEYEYEVKEVSGGAEKPVELIGTRKIKGGDKSTPSTPINLLAKQGDGKAVFSWDFVAGEDLGTTAAGFFIYRKTEEETAFKTIGYSIPGRSVTNSFSDMGLKNGVEYSYYISSVNIAGFESKPSETVKITPVDMTPPAAPENMSASFDNDKKFVKMKWEELANEDFSHFNVYRTSNISEGTFKKVNKENVAAPEYIDTEATFDGKTYFYTITAVDKTGNESQKTSPVTVTVPDMTPPSPPVNVKAEFVRETKSVKLTWNHGPSNDVSVYAIFRGISKDNLLLAKTIGPENLEYKDEIVVEKETYYYSVNSQDRMSNISEPEKVIEIKIPDMTQPPTPFNLQVVPDPSAMKIKAVWNDVKSDDFKQYAVYRSLKKEGEKAAGYEQIGLSDKPEFIDESAKKGVLYWYRVSQVDTSDNESNLCKPAGEKLRDNEPPEAPVDPAAVFKKDGVAVTWKTNVEDDIAGYNIYLVDLFRFTDTRTNKEPINVTEFLIDISLITNEGNFGLKLSAVDTSDNESQKTSVFKPSM